MSSLSLNRYFMSSQCADSRNLVVHSSLLSLEVSIVVLFQPTLLKEKIIVEEQKSLTVLPSEVKYLLELIKEPMEEHSTCYLSLSSHPAASLTASD